MLWRGQRESDNVVDERGQSGARPIHLGVGGIVLVLAVSYFTGQNPLTLLAILSNGTGSSANVGSSYQSSAAEEETKKFLSVVLASTEDVWSEEFKKAGRQYQPPALVLFTDEVGSACGYTEAATGPFYCPEDRRLYIDMGFLGQLQHQLGADGDFAAAYVVAHEVGHHVQRLLGIDRPEDRSPGANGGLVRTELQADCLAGVWGHYAQQAGLLEMGDVQEGINAAKSVGDDRIQSMGAGYVNPESFTHGSGAERARWFNTGMSSGDYRNCDTYAGR